ncbi:uncharacterized protein LOC117336839 [Pecten maximus]|nr:uncharacterized protein LOC117336839 [Pecten maximus]
MIYKELAMDAAIAAHPITQERLRLIFLGNTGLVRDLRSLNPGRPSGKFDTFFDALSGQIENITAADDRRHGVAHLSEFISLKEMITKAKNECPEGTPIPSKSLVRLQFAPRNPYSKTAHNFTSRINVQHKIQRRQLRVSHPDDHYCNAQFKYLKQKAINQQNCTLLFCDDKAKVPFGDPGHLISTGVRGKKTIVPSTTTLVALDHDMNHSSLTPSVILQCDIPKEINDSFVRGQVTTVINDSVLQQSSPFRHNAVLAKLLAEKETMQPILMKFTDGGTDQRNNIESVKCATICLFRELNLDMIILGRCAPGHSYVNPAERVMSILNLGLQNVALQREVSDEESEKYFKRCNGMADMRELLNTKKPELKQSWIDVVEPVQSIIRNRFLRLSLKDVPFAAMDPVPDTDIDLLKRHLRELFPDLDLQKLTKAHASKVESYTSWMASHSRSRHYTFQVRKCEDLSCCSAPTLPREQLNWLPDPVLDASGDHYRPYSEVEDMDTDEKDRPSLKAAPKRKEKRTADVGQPAAAENRGEGATAVDREPATSDQQEEDAALPEPDPHLCTSQNARAVVTCVECQKPRVIYSRHKLTDRQTMTVALATSEFEYTCGSPLLPPTTSLYTKVMCRSNITCSTTVELQFYASSLGRTDICCFCTAENSDVDTQLLKKYKTVLPMCASCTSKGKQAVVARPF